MDTNQPKPYRIDVVIRTGVLDLVVADDALKGKIDVRYHDFDDDSEESVASGEAEVKYGAEAFAELEQEIADAKVDA